MVADRPLSHIRIIEEGTGEIVGVTFVHCAPEVVRANAKSDNTVNDGVRVFVVQHVRISGEVVQPTSRPTCTFADGQTLGERRKKGVVHRLTQHLACVFVDRGMPDDNRYRRIQPRKVESILEIVMNAVNMEVSVSLIEATVRAGIKPEAILRRKGVVRKRVAEFASANPYTSRTVVYQDIDKIPLQKPRAVKAVEGAIDGVSRCNRVFLIHRTGAVDVHQAVRLQ